VVHAFLKAIKEDGSHAGYVSRAKNLDPTMPFLTLALLHRGILQEPRLDWAKERFGSRTASTYLKIDNRFRALVRHGLLAPSARVIDAGCGWGRLGRRLIEFLDAGRYFGLDIDEFELRSFVQFEIGLENPTLMTKRPSILRSENFEFERLLGQQRPHSNASFRPHADLIIFSSVLKSSMPNVLRKTALCNAARVLSESGRVAIFNDCDDTQLAGIASHTGAFSKFSFPENNCCVLSRTAAPPSAAFC
jgi:SAM-dependent methyltransferase